MNLIRREPTTPFTLFRPFETPRSTGRWKR